MRYADIYLKEIGKLIGHRGTDAGRAHQESFLYHLAGAVEAFLPEMNWYYGCGLPDTGISPGKRREAITKVRGQNAPELVELRTVEETLDSWLNHMQTMRHHCTHVGGVPRVVNLGG